MIDPLVRPAEAADVDQLMFLEAEGRTALVDQRGGPRWLADHGARGRRWPVDAGAVWVAHIDEVVVGYIVVSVNGTLARVEEVYVTPAARELGFGDAMLSAGITAARQRGARTLDGEALPGDRETKNLYERAGIKARLITVSSAI